MADADSVKGDRPPTAYEQIVEQAADLLQMGSDWLRQEAESTVREKVVLPLQRLGLTVAAAATAGTLFVMGVLLVLIGLLVFLGRIIGWDVTLWILGAVLIVGSGIVLGVMYGKVQR
ncbi:MAG: hypothetical protein FDZ70_03265 [Actinobacteria bacterium]|nr:MAG: hypothetical protein FDZ70_03265 [Actinomycetota bacterium]